VLLSCAATVIVPVPVALTSEERVIVALRERQSAWIDRNDCGGMPKIDRPAPAETEPTEEQRTEMKRSQAEWGKRTMAESPERWARYQRAYPTDDWTVLAARISANSRSQIDWLEARDARSFDYAYSILGECCSIAGVRGSAIVTSDRVEISEHVKKGRNNCPQ